MIKKFVEVDENNITINFLNDAREGFKEVQIPDEWNEAFCTRTTDFKLETDEDGINIVKPKNTLIIATWEEFNTTKATTDEVKKKNEELQVALDKSDEALENTNAQLDQADEKINQLQQMITFMSNQGGGTDE